jgi:hypothetical protein
MGLCFSKDIKNQNECIKEEILELCYHGQEVIRPETNMFQSSKAVIDNSINYVVQDIGINTKLVNTNTNTNINNTISLEDYYDL